jgi:hypothetical protein
LYNYRQYLENGTGRFGGSPELTFNGTSNGAIITTSIVRAISDVSALFKAGVNLTFGGRFITDINCDLNTNGALFDFSDSNFTNDESLIVSGVYVTRNSVLNSLDVAIHPNINEDSVKCAWKDNNGIPNTTKYIKAVCTAEITTTISNSNTYYPMLGTMTVDTESHFSMPVNGEYELLSGNGTYQIFGEVDLESDQGDDLGLRAVKSEDGGVTFPTEVNGIFRTVNSFSGNRDVAFFPMNFIVRLSKGDRIRLEVENRSGTADIMQELGGYFIATKI